MELFVRFIFTIFGLLDSVVYEFISTMYNLLMDIAHATPFTEGTFAEFANRIYALLGLFMLFKVSFSLIKYIVNPDDFNDKVKGGRKLVLNIIIVLVLIVVTPMAFKLMYSFQDTLLQEEVLEKLILGKQMNGETVDKSTVGDDIKMAVFTAFYGPKDATCRASNPGNTEQFVNDCKNYLGQNVAATYANAYQKKSIWNLLHDTVDGEPLYMVKKADGERAISYMYLISTIVGAVTALIFLNFCIDIAIRMVKLGFLELISPIPIISYIDPSSAKNGMFSKWIKEVFKTFIDLFVRLGAVYFAITLIFALLRNLDFGISNFFARVFIILGILIFAQQIPKLLGDLLGVKLDGNFSLNPMAKINTSPFAAAAVGGVTGFATGAAANAFSRVKDFRADMNGKDWNLENIKNSLTDGKTGWDGFTTGASHIFSPLGGAFSAGARAFITGTHGKGSAIKAGLEGATAASRLRNARDGGYGMGDKVIDHWKDVAGIRLDTGTTSEIENKIKMNQLQISNYKRDEQSYSQQLADIARVNPSEYAKAFEEKIVRDANGDVQRNENGSVKTERTFNNYAEYFDKLAGEAGLDMTSAIQSYTSQGISEIEARKRIYENNAKRYGLLSEKEYSDYEVVRQARDKSDDEARKLEKRNKELQGYLDSRKGKPKK